MFKANRCYEQEMNMENNNNMNYDMPGSNYMTDPGMGCAPIVECPCERVCHREICHNVEHIQPINTRIINHHIYRHTYTPCYTCCEENEVCNIYDQNPCCR